MRIALLKLLVPILLIPSLAYNQSADPNPSIEKSIDSILGKMSLTEKIGQASQRGTSSRVKILPEELKQAVREGRVGSVLNVLDRNNVDELQRIAIKESPHGIPILFGRDVIHGYKTIFPIPLGQAATWNPGIVERGAAIAAEEASTNGIRWTFAPMLDISRDPRWGRIAESAGEDPYLASVLGRAYVKGFQGDDMSAPNKIAACAKHFVGYGAAEGGRDYNSVMLSENTLRDTYLKPFKAAIDAGIATVMTSFNDINGVPASGNKFILKTILRGEWNFKGFVVSDWNSITEMIAHGYCADAKEAAFRAANAGLDMEMTSTSYENNLRELIKEGRFTEAQLNDMVRNILRIKFKLGLFKSPYVDRSRDEKLLSKQHLADAKEAAVESMVLLKNKNDILPLSKNNKIDLIGPLANAPHEQMGTWIFDGKDADAITPLTSLQAALGKKLVFTPGLANSRDRRDTGFKEAIAAAMKADVILFFGGEESILSGEAHSRADISLPGAQEQLIKALKKTGRPIVLIILAGRPITLGNILDDVDAIVMGWHPGTMAGPAITDLLLGNASPSGRLPVTWPKAVGQIPIYYNHFNTGRPATAKTFVQLDSIPVGAWQSSLGNASHYLDLGFEPQYPFGYGLQYTSFDYSNIMVSNAVVSMNGSVEVSATISNSGKRAGTEIVQFYVQDLVGDVVRPVRELKGFKRITLEPGQKQEVKFSLTAADLSFHNQAMKEVTEPGKFKVWIGKNASEGLEAAFELK
ncbi:MAG: bglX [Ferruginibacter sp.]|nr:bglX [Ferruginibacter sp.]